MKYDLSINTLLTIIFAFSSAVLVVTLQRRTERLKIVENQLSDKKYKMYSELLYIFFDVSMSEKTGENISQQDLMKRLIAIKRDMYLYAPDEIFRGFTKWLLDLHNHDNPTKQFKDYYELIKLIRKDMGNRATKLSLDDFMLFYMQSREEYAKFKSQNGW